MSDEEYFVQTPSTISSFNEEISVNSNTSVSEVKRKSDLIGGIFISPEKLKNNLPKISSPKKPDENPLDILTSKKESNWQISISPDGENVLMFNHDELKFKIIPEKNINDSYEKKSYDVKSVFKKESKNNYPKWMIAISNSITNTLNEKEVLVAISRVTKSDTTSPGKKNLNNENLTITSVNQFEEKVPRPVEIVTTDTTVDEGNTVIYKVKLNQNSKPERICSDLPGGIVIFVHNDDNDKNSIYCFVFNVKGICRKKFSHDLSDKEVNQFNYPKRLQDELKSLYKKKSCIARLFNSIFDHYFFIEQYKEGIQCLQLYDLKTMEMKQFFDLHEGKLRKFGIPIFAKSNNEKIIAFSFGFGKLFLFLVENGLEIASEDFGKGVKILFCDFINNDHTIIVIIQKPGCDDRQIYYWNLFSTNNHVKSGRKVNFVMDEENISSIARIPGKFITVDTYGNISSVFGRLVNNCDPEEEGKEIYSIVIHNGNLVESPRKMSFSEVKCKNSGKKHTIYHSQKKETEPLVKNKEPWDLLKHKHIGWLSTVSEALPDFYRYNLTSYAKGLFFKRCISGIKISKMIEYEDIIPKEIEVIVKASQEFIAFNPNTKLISTKDETQKSISLRFKELNVKIFSNTENLSPTVKIIPLRNFTVRKREKLKHKAFLLKVFQYVFIPRRYLSDIKLSSPLVQIVRNEKNEDDIFDNPTMAAAINYKWGPTRNYFLGNFFRYILFAACFAALVGCYLGHVEATGHLYNLLVFLFILFYYSGVYLFLVECIQLRHHSWRYYLDFFNFVDLASVVISLVLVSVYVTPSFRLSNAFADVVATSNITAGLSFTMLLLWFDFILHLRLFLDFSDLDDITSKKSSYTIQNSAGDVIGTSLQDFDRKQDNPSKDFGTSFLSTYAWLRGSFPQEAIWDFWAVEALTLIGSLVLITVIQNMFIAFLSSAHAEAFEKGRAALLYYRAKLISDYEMIDEIYFSSPPSDPKYIYYLDELKSYDTWEKLVKTYENKLYDGLEKIMDETELSFKEKNNENSFLNYNKPDYDDDNSSNEESTGDDY
ncbi:unnamed protein product [Rhizophagus irregularis]|nr:unnamed protein product [Rhizophagus irregularis]